MSMFNEMKNIKDKIEYLLETKPHLRDCDSKLIATLYYFEIGKNKLDDLTGFDVLNLIAENKLTNSGSVIRVRRKLQVDNPDLRGLSYKKRHNESEHIRKNINKEL